MRTRCEQPKMDEKQGLYEATCKTDQSVTCKVIEGFPPFQNR